MRILGIDSSTPRSSVALLENGRIRLEIAPLDISTPSNHLLSLIDHALAEAGCDFPDMDGFAVTRGPGSFTGLRVAVSLVKGLVLSAEKPFVGVGTLEAVAFLAEQASHPICAILDARKKEVYAAKFRFEGETLIRLTEDQAVSPDILCEGISEPTLFAGSGLETYETFLSEKLGPYFIKAKNFKHNSVAAGAAILASRHFKARKSFDLDQLNIHYVRKSEAELNYSGTF